MAVRKLELTWIGKENRPRLEPRILLEDPARSYHARHRVKMSSREEEKNLTRRREDAKEERKGEKSIVGEGLADAHAGALSTSHASLRGFASSRETEIGDIFDNRLIFGDNLLALKALEAEFTGKVKCVFIDPPYNTGSAFTHYDDGVEHSIWLSLMRDRLEIIRRLLSEDGSLWITIDDNECHYLKVLCDEIFGRACFLANVVWEKRTSRENRRVFSFNHDHVLVYARSKPLFEKTRNALGLNSEVLARYKNPDNDPRGPWQSVSVNAQAGHATASQFYQLILPSGRAIDPPKGRCWLYTKPRMQEEVSAGNIWFGSDGDNAPRAKKFLRDYEEKGLTPETIWPAAEVGTNDDAKKGLLALLLDVPVFDNPKPESLLERVIHIATNPGDLVLDSFAGSGTTGAVAHKMGRRWIMVELGEHCHTHIIPRLKKVIDGEDPGGITKAVDWKGGGGFRYYRLAPSLLEKDTWGNWVINHDYNAAMLAEALCKLEGFSYAPSDSLYWQHGRSTERDFIYVTTASLTQEQLAQLSDEVGPERSLLVLCTSFRAKADLHPNLTVKKIPHQILARCEWGHDDYSLRVENLPSAPLAPGQLDLF
ncbi:site-specific DNA-methyltransferase [uncultured Thiodictyon sp.]|uniref:site-specific DNA-methyltransferase n=1 Tax=uncultured Thiodictyon sp. TaxID=1846217 RepID=UPI0025E30596|nr:site-specific DNA-methyltransferase [uncultured Thiodictyon sp.]